MARASGAISSRAAKLPPKRAASLLYGVDRMERRRTFIRSKRGYIGTQQIIRDLFRSSDQQRIQNTMFMLGHSRKRAAPGMKRYGHPLYEAIPIVGENPTPLQRRSQSRVRKQDFGDAPAYGASKWPYPWRRYKRQRRT